MCVLNLEVFDRAKCSQIRPCLLSVPGFTVAVQAPEHVFRLSVMSHP